MVRNEDHVQKYVAPEENERMKGDLVSTVDPTDFKKAWEVRQACFGSYIDVESVKPIFKSETSVEAAIFRATMLLVLTQTMPDVFAEFMDNGQPNDALLAAFAKTPLVKGDDINVGELLKTLHQNLRSNV